MRTARVPGPPTGEAVYEPHVAVHAGGALAVGGQFGTGYNRGGLRFWVATSGDGGATFRASEARPMTLEAPPTMAADLTLSFGAEGRLHMLGLSADSTRAGVPDASVAWASVEPDGSVTPLATPVVPRTPGPGLLAAADKPWMIATPGGFTLAWTALEVDLDHDPVSIEREILLARAAHGSVEPPVHVADEGMGVQMAAGAHGILDVVWIEVREQGALAPRRVMHAMSHDGGQSFTDPDVVADGGSQGAAVGLPTLASSGTGGSMACWSQWTDAGVDMAVACRHFASDLGWTPVPTPSTSAAPRPQAYPVVTRAGGSWWLAAYDAGPDSVHVRLYEARDGGPFELRETLAGAVLPTGGFCPSSGLPCRADPSAFLPGDYVGVASTEDRIVAAYVLPRDPADQLYVSVIDLEPGA